jgi:cytochrome c peroxidase
LRHKKYLPFTFKKLKIMRNKALLFAAIALLTVTLYNCNSTEELSQFGLKPELPAEPYDYSLKANALTNGVDPNGFNNFGLQFNQNNPQITNEGATLGRVLFYDPQLSINNSISCASCHKQELAFSDGVAGSTGFGGKVTPRNSMAIINAGFNNNLFWDSRVQSVSELAVKPIQNHIEMGMESMTRLSGKLAKIDYYKDLFKKAFGTEQISEERIGKALAEFVCSITATNSRFDQRNTNNGTQFSSLESLGEELYFSPRTNCNRCHAAPSFAAPDFVGGEYGGGTTFIVDSNGQFISSSAGDDVKGTANNGLDLVYQDNGLGNGKFRIPSLRNIELTAPYMHDGRFTTLEEVVEHYNTGVKPHNHLDKNLKNADGSPLRPDLNSLEQKALVAFLKTLTDETTVKDVKWSNPFK